jgi:hypothetical protein
MQDVTTSQFNPLYIQFIRYLRAENMINVRARLESGESLISEESSETSVNSTISKIRCKEDHLLLLAPLPSLFVHLTLRI